MALLNDILVWATANLLPWQRDALRRLFQKQTLDASDIDDLYAMLRANRGIPDPKNRQPIPLSQQHLPAQASTSAPVALLAMRELKYVNRIVPNQELNFAPKGMTVIYGSNASGKSGYSRVLKCACRARDLAETIHPDAYDPAATARVPEATFDIDEGGKKTSVHWTRDATSADELSMIAVFDSRCARSYLDSEQDVAYLPYGLDIVESLGQAVLPQLTKRLNAEIEATDTDTSAFSDLAGETAVGKAIGNLGPDTDASVIEKLATLSEAETTRLDELERTLAENDPKARAKVLRLSAQRLTELTDRITAGIAVIDDTHAEALKSACTEAKTAGAAENTAATAFQSGEDLLPGTGAAVWKKLFEAARRFSVDHAYSGKPFPHTDADARCVLCQQPLDQVSAGRLKRFEEFVQRDTAKVAADKREEQKKMVQEMTGASLGFGMGSALTEELKTIDPALLQEIVDLEKQIEERRKWLLNAATTGEWDSCPVLADSPVSRLATIASKAVTDAGELEKASDESQREVLTKEREALRARKALSLRRQAVLDLIKRMKLKAALASCKTDLGTRAISAKAKEFASRAVTATLRTALNNEFDALGVGHIRTKLNERVEQGKMKHKLVLDLPVTRKLDEILSEGEQRAVAIGSFLAEMRLAGHKGGIVFDDPVSSLDHHWRQRVAGRLVGEAAERQVIVFTHDTVFLAELLDALDRSHANQLVHHLDRISDKPGYILPGLPQEHQKYTERLDQHEKAQRKLASNWPAIPGEADREAIRREYSLLRATIERVVQDVVLNGVVRRYADWIRVGNLSDVVGFCSTECAEIERLYQTCNGVVDAHDPSSAKNSSVPDPAQLGKNIADLNAVVETIRTRRKAAKNTAAPTP